MFESCVNALWSAVQLSEEDTLVPRGRSSEDQGELSDRWEFCTRYVYYLTLRSDISGESVKECTTKTATEVVACIVVDAFYGNRHIYVIIIPA